MTLCSLLALTESGTDVYLMSKDGYKIVEGKDLVLLNYLSPEVLKNDVFSITARNGLGGAKLLVTLDIIDESLSIENEG